MVFHISPAPMSSKRRSSGMCNSKYEYKSSNVSHVAKIFVFCNFSMLFLSIWENKLFLKLVKIYFELVACGLLLAACGLLLKNYIFLFNGADLREQVQQPVTIYPELQESSFQRMSVA